MFLPAGTALVEATSPSCALAVAAAEGRPGRTPAGRCVGVLEGPLGPAAGRVGPPSPVLLDPEMKGAPPAEGFGFAIGLNWVAPLSAWRNVVRQSIRAAEPNAKLTDSAHLAVTIRFEWSPGFHLCKLTTLFVSASPSG
jgi:hypothetical protein